MGKLETISMPGWDGSYPGGGSGSGGSGGGGPVPPGYYADGTAAETATLQILLGERIAGLVDGLKSIYLDGTPIKSSDGKLNFSGIALALTAGTATQPAIKGITGTESETSVNVQATASTSVTRSITSNPSAVRVRIAIPALKVVSQTDGGSSGNDVQVKIERQNANYTPSGLAKGAWETVALEGDGSLFGGPFSTKFTKSYRIDLPIPGTWQIRVSRVSPDDPDDWHQSQTWWEAYTEIVDAKLRYPYSSVLSLRVNAKQFKSIPKVTCDVKLSPVMVPTNYDPIARTYATSGAGTTGGAWDGSFKEAWSDNPAWAFYDAATKTRYGAGTFLAASMLDKWTLYSIAQWCDTLVPDGKGGTEPRMTCNLYMQSQQNAIKALGQLASVFWGAVYYASGLVTPIADSDAAPVAIFNNSNVIDGRFTYEGTARTARHTAAVVAFTNPDLGWEQDTAVYEDKDGIARFGYNPLDLTAVGCTSQGQALRLAKWSILTELMAPETCSFSSGLEGSTVKPGDVVQCSDQFRAGNVRSGGRVAAGATTTTIPLDGPVTLDSGTYTLKIKNPSGVLESRTVTTSAGTVQSLTVTPAFSVAPLEGAVWLLQAGSKAALWRVLSVKKGDGIQHDITALLHDPAKYVALGLATGEVVPRTWTPSTIAAPVGLTLSVTDRILNDRHVQNLEASWTLDGAQSYVASASRDFGPWQTMACAGASAILGGADPGAWRVRVAGVWSAGVSMSSEASVTVTAPTTPPGWVAGAIAGVSTLNNDDVLSRAKKPQAISDYNAEVQVRAQLQAAALACSPQVDHSAYTNALNTLATFLGALSPAWTDLSQDTPLGNGGGATLRSRWSTIGSTRQALQNSIGQAQATKASNDAISAAATDAANKALDAINKTELHLVAFSSSALPALPNASYPAKYFVKTTDNRKFKVNDAGTAWGEIMQAAIGIFGQIVASQMVLTNTDNLIPNPNSEQPAPAGGWPSGAYESRNLSTNNPHTGTYCRLLGSAEQVAISPPIPVTPGDPYMVSVWAYNYGGGGATAFLWFTNSQGEWKGIIQTEILGVQDVYTKLIGSGPVPAGATSMQVFIKNTSSSGNAFFDDMCCRDMTDANLLVDGAVITKKLQATAVQTNNFTQGVDSDNGGIYAATGAAMVVNTPSTPALIVDSAGLKIGRRIFTDYWFRLLNGIDGTSSSGLVVWRGNNDPTQDGGAPRIADNGSNPAGNPRLLINSTRIIGDTLTSLHFQAQPVANTDNLDALTHVETIVWMLSGTIMAKEGAVGYPAISSRRYVAPSTPTATTNAGHGAWNALCRSGVTGISSATTPMILQCRLCNVYGASAQHYFLPPSGPGDGTASATGRWTDAGTSAPYSGGDAGGAAGGGSGVGGGGCPAPWVPITLASGLTIPAGSLIEGMEVLGVDEATREPRVGIVRDIQPMWVDRVRVVLEDGRDPEFTHNHRVALANGTWIEAETLAPGDLLAAQRESRVKAVVPTGKGRVISFTVEGCHTYFSDDILSHNVKTRTV